MSAPIPLAAPDGAVYAYACGRCHRVAGGVHVPGPVSPVARLAELSLHRATRCCVCQCGAPMSPASRWRECDACSAKHDAESAAYRAAYRSARAKSLAARGMRECALCDGTGSLDLDDVDCGACGGTGAVAL